MQPWREDTFISICSVGTSRGRGVSMTFSHEIRTTGRASLGGHLEVFGWDSLTFMERDEDEEEVEEEEVEEEEVEEEEESCFY